MKKWYIIILAIILVMGAGYLFMYKIPANKADQAISEFVKKENKNNARIKESKLYKNWKLGGFYKFVDYSDDKNYTYQYLYDSGAKEWKDNIFVDVGQLEKGKKPKHYYTK